MRSIGIRDMLDGLERVTGQPADEFATYEVLSGFRRATAAAYAAGERDGLPAAVVAVARELVRAAPDQEVAAPLAEDAVEVLVTRNGGTTQVDRRVVVLRLNEAVRDPGQLEEVLPWLRDKVVPPAALPRKMAQQERRLFGPRQLEPVEIGLGLAHPLATVHAAVRSKLVPRLQAAARTAVREAERELHGRLTFRLEHPPEHLPPDAPAAGSDDELWQVISTMLLEEVHGLVVCDLGGVAASEGVTHERVLHQLHGGPALWIQDPGCKVRGKLGTAAAREAGVRIASCADPAKLARIIRRWLVRTADALEWSARSRDDLRLLYGGLQARLEAAWRRAPEESRDSLRAAGGLSQRQIDRAITSVHFLDAIAGWQLDAVRGWLGDAPAPTRSGRREPTVVWESLLQAQDEFGWSGTTTSGLRRHVYAELRDRAAVPLKRTYRQPSDWAALKRELRL